MKTSLLFTIALAASCSLQSQNNPPVANNDSLTVLSGQALIKNLVGNDTDPDGNTLAIDTVLYLSDYGTVQKLNNTAIRYTADSFYFGKDTVWYVICDNGNPSLCDTAMLFVTVNYKFYANYVHLDAGNINARVNSSGELFTDVPVSGPFFEVPKGSGKNSIFTSNLWIGAKDANDSLHLAAQMYGQSGNDYFIGPVATDYTSADYTSRYNYAWKVSSADISNHLQNFKSPGYVIPEEILNWPAQGDPVNGEAANLAPFVDFNKNGLYDPQNGDYPSIKGDQAAFIIFNDDAAHTESGGKKLGVEIHALVYEFNKPSDSAVFNAVFVDYKIHNRSVNNYDSLYIGEFTDLDLGNYADDYIGCDSSLNLFYAYNGDGLDDGATGYGATPPAQGIAFVNYPMNKFIMFNNDNTVTGNPAVVNDYYNYLKGNWKDGSSLTYGGSGYATGSPSDYMFSGDPVTGANWTETNSGVAPGDRRGLGIVGPLTLASGSSFDLQLAFPFADDYSGNNLTSVDLLKQRIPSLSLPYYTISGSILNKDGTSSINAGDVFLIAYDTAATAFQYIGGTSIGSNGDYLFGNVMPGNYLVFVRPDAATFPNTIPTYYGDTAYWGYSQILAVGSDTTGIDIRVRQTPVWAGTGFCSGTIRFGLGSGKTNNGSVVPFGDPVPGIDINLEQIPGGIIKAHTTTNDSGFYSINNIPMNTSYKLLVDIPGLPMDSTHSIIINPSDSVITDLDFVVDTAAGAGGIYIGYPLGIKSQISNLKSQIIIYPNPNRGAFTLEFSGTVGKNDYIFIYNIFGQLIYHARINKSKEEIETPLPPGLYFLKIQMGNTVSLTKIAVE